MQAAVNDLLSFDLAEKEVPEESIFEPVEPSEENKSEEMVLVTQDQSLLRKVRHYQSI